MIRLTHVSVDFEVGGASTMLLNLLAHTDRASFDVHALSLTEVGPVGERIRSLGIPVTAIGLRRSLPHPGIVQRVAGELRRQGSHVVQTWMYHSDLLGGLAGQMAQVPVVWGLRQSDLSPAVNKATTLLAARACARLSRRLPERIVCCSESSRRAHVSFGYSATPMVVIHNGFDVGAFGPDPGARESVRRELGLASDSVVVGLVARYDRQKDHRTFVAAAARLSARCADVHFVLCGQGVTWDNPELSGWIDQAGLRPRFHLLGLRQDVARLTAAFDIASSSSSGEGFCNAIGEAMACGVPCVATDVGDADVLLQTGGRVVGTRDPDALAWAWQDLVLAGPELRAAVGAAGRRRVQEHFAISAVASRYQSLYEEVYAGVRHSRVR